MSVLLQVDLREFLIALSNENPDETFRQSLDQATESLADAQSDYITLFMSAWNEKAGEKKLSSIFRFSDALKDQITANTTDADMGNLLRTEANARPARPGRREPEPPRR